MYISKCKIVDINNEFANEFQRKISLLKLINKNIFHCCSQVILTKNHYYLIWTKNLMRVDEERSFSHKKSEKEIIIFLNCFRKIFKDLNKLHSYHGHLNQKSIQTFKSSSKCQFLNETELKRYKTIIEIQEKDEVNLQDNQWMVYYPPEVFLYKKFSQKTDIWAFGVICYSLIYGKLPWNIEDLSLNEFFRQKVYRDIQFPERQGISSKLTHLIYCCLKPDMDLRFCYQDFLDSEYFSDLSNKNQTKINKTGNQKQIQQLSSMKTLNSCENYLSQQKPLI